MGMTISNPIAIPIPVATRGRIKARGELSVALDDLEIGMALEITGASASKLSSAAVAAGKREAGKKFAVRKTTKVIDGEPVYGIWRLT